MGKKLVLSTIVIVTILALIGVGVWFVSTQQFAIQTAIKELYIRQPTIYDTEVFELVKNEEFEPIKHYIEPTR